MEFEEAIVCLKRGERIKRRSWKTAYLFQDGTRIKMRMGFRKPWNYTFKNYDIFSDDWLISVSHLFEDDEDEKSN